MKIGIVSDSHGNASLLRRAIDELLSRGAEAIVHCGDLGGAECLSVLAEADVETYAVLGNMDLGGRALESQAGRRGVHFGTDSVLLPLDDGTHLAAAHGNKAEILNGLIDSGDCRYVCTGHTHTARDQRVGSVRVINPGAINQAHSASIALLDTQTDALEMISLA